MQRASFALWRIAAFTALLLVVLLAGCDGGGNGMEEEEEEEPTEPNVEAVQYALSATPNDGALPDGVSATVTFQALGESHTLVTLTLDNGPTGLGVAHPAHIHLNSADEGGDIEIFLAPIDGLDQPANNATSSRVVDRSLDDLLSFDGHVNIHESNANLGTIVAQGDVGANAEGTSVDPLPLVDDPRSASYTLDPVANEGEIPDGVEATVVFEELGDDMTLVTLRLTDGPTGTPFGHPAHIHLNSADEGGGIEIFLAPIDGLSHPANDAVSSQIVDRSYDELTGFDGHVNIHESNASLSTVIARGDVGANAGGNDGGDGGGGNDGGNDGGGYGGGY